MMDEKVIELCRKHGWTVCTETTDLYYMMGPMTHFEVELRDEQGRLLVWDEVGEPFASGFINKVLLPLARFREYIPPVSDGEEPAADTIARICRETLDDIDDASDRDYEDARGLVTVSCECMLNMLQDMKDPASLEEPDLYASGLAESLNDMAWGMRQMAGILCRRKIW